MKHMQQQQSSILPHKFLAAVVIISEVSCNLGSAVSGGRFSAVAFKLPKPAPTLRRTITFLPLDSLICTFNQCHAAISMNINVHSFFNQTSKFKNRLVVQLKHESHTCFSFLVSSKTKLVYSEGTPVCKLILSTCNHT